MMDPCLYTKRGESGPIIVGVCVDDVVVEGLLRDTRPVLRSSAKRYQAYAK